MNALQYEKWGLDLLERFEQAEEWMNQIESNKGNLTHIETEIFMDKLNSLAAEVEIYKEGIKKTRCANIGSRRKNIC
jgi:ATP/maltotriose-dependent transcriptional regulator MalT